RAEASAAGLLVNDFVSAMTGDTYAEQLQRVAALPEAEPKYYAVAAFGRRDELDPLTKKFSLWKQRKRRKRPRSPRSPPRHAREPRRRVQVPLDLSCGGAQFGQQGVDAVLQGAAGRVGRHVQRGDRTARPVAHRYRDRAQPRLQFLVDEGIAPGAYVGELPF